MAAAIAAQNWFGIPLRALVDARSKHCMQFCNLESSEMLKTQCSAGLKCSLTRKTSRSFWRISMRIQTSMGRLERRNHSGEKTLPENPQTMKQGKKKIPCFILPQPSGVFEKPGFSFRSQRPKNWYGLTGRAHFPWATSGITSKNDE